MDPNKPGISNRESAAEEQEEREIYARDEDTTRDRAGHVDTESPAERLQREEDEHVQAPVPESKRGKGTRSSSAGGL
ncbi:MAG TPA: hypothetical protein VIL35_01885 [Vicinamibacterales bacterium]